MGWSGGSILFSDVWTIIQEYIPEHAREDVLVRMIRAFEDLDCDTLGEVGYDFPEVDEVLRKLYPEYYEDFS
jgi:hypothetical protein